jgi:hypothetical protein
MSSNSDVKYVSLVDTPTSSSSSSSSSFPSSSTDNKGCDVDEENQKHTAEEKNEVNDMLTEYHVTSMLTDVNENKETEVFQWHELKECSTSFSVDDSVVDKSVVDKSVVDSDEDYSDMPPLVYESDESNTEEHEDDEDEDEEEEDEDEEDEDEEDEEDEEEDEDEEEEEEEEEKGGETCIVLVERSNSQEEIPPFLLFTGVVFFILHLIHYIQLLNERELHDKVSCFLMRRP